MVYFIRFAEKVPLTERKHALTLGRWYNYLEAVTECENRDPSGKRLLVVRR